MICKLVTTHGLVNTFVTTSFIWFAIDKAFGATNKNGSWPCMCVWIMEIRESLGILERREVRTWLQAVSPAVSCRSSAHMFTAKQSANNASTRIRKLIPEVLKLTYTKQFSSFVRKMIILFSITISFISFNEQIEHCEYISQGQLIKWQEKRS